jgi:hypothetical protein
MEPFFAEWLEFLRLLTRHRVRFLLIGGHAIAVHGQPRYTEDLDVFVAATPANARRLRAALVDFGYGAVTPTVDMLATRNKVFMLGRAPFRIDILTGIDGVTFEEAWSTRVPLDVEGARVFVIGLAALIANKRASGRPKDLVDVTFLEERQRRMKKSSRTDTKGRTRRQAVRSR